MGTIKTTPAPFRKKSVRPWTGLVPAGLLAAGLAWGIAGKRGGPARPIATYAFVDESPSMTRKPENGRSVQQLGLDFLDTAVDGTLPPRSEMKVWAFAGPNGVRSMWEGRPAGAEDLAALQEWATANPRKEEGTYALPAFKEAIAAAKSSAARKEDCAVVIISDTEWDDLGKLDAAARQLAALPNVRAIVVAPVSMEGTFRSRIASVLAPLGPRAIVANRTDIDQADARLRQILAR